jgi:MOSC domain-containing protein YiiM
MNGLIVAIYVATTRHAEQLSVESVQLKAGKGIVGDRFYGNRPKHPELNLTLIEAENIEGFNREYNQTIGLGTTRRNLITRGIQLNALVGKRFQVGSVLCKGIELCEPCKVMARNFPETSLSQNEIISALIHNAGIRAEVLVDGIVKLEDHLFLV